MWPPSTSVSLLPFGFGWKMGIQQSSLELGGKDLRAQPGRDVPLRQLAAEECVTRILGAERTMMVRAMLFPQHRLISKLSEGPTHALGSVSEAQSLN